MRQEIKGSTHSRAPPTLQVFHIFSGIVVINSSLLPPGHVAPTGRGYLESSGQHGTSTTLSGLEGESPSILTPEQGDSGLWRSHTRAPRKVYEAATGQTPWRNIGVFGLGILAMKCG